MKRRGLGRGLDALLASSDVEPTGLVEVPIEAVRLNPYQPRREMADDTLTELAASIRAHGVIQPLVVRAAGDEYELITGERRLRAARLAGLTTVPVVVRQADGQEMLALALVENLQRSDLNPIEAATAYRRLMTEFGLTQEEIARLVGKSRAAIANTVRLLSLAPEVQELVVAGQLSEGHGRTLAGVRSADHQLELCRRAVARGWTVRQLESHVQRLARAQALRPAGRASQGASAASDERVVAFERALGTRVEIRRRGRGGQLVIHFYSDEELAAIYDRLVPGS